jgi:hypothetical protein
LSYDRFNTGDIATDIAEGTPILKILGDRLAPQTVHLLLQLIELAQPFVGSHIA